MCNKGSKLQKEGLPLAFSRNGLTPTVSRTDKTSLYAMEPGAYSLGQAAKHKCNEEEPCMGWSAPASTISLLARWFSSSIYK